MQGLDINPTQGEFNKPRVFMKRQIELFSDQTDDLKEKEVSAQTISSLLFPEKFAIPNYPLITEDDIKNNSMFDMYDATDGTTPEDVKIKLKMGIRAVDNSKLDDGMMRAFFLAKLKNEKHPLPMVNNSYIRIEDNGDVQLRCKIYKDQHSRILSIPWENVESIRMLTLTTMRGFERAQKQKVSCAKHLDDTSTEFNLDAI